jgi:hypothetical protein
VHALYLTPGSEKVIVNHPGFGDVTDFLIPPGPTFHALVHEEAVVYSVRGERLRNITDNYAAALPAAWEKEIPTRIDLANPAEGYLLGPEWHKIEFDHRWMPQRATLQLSGPRQAGAKLHLAGAAGRTATRLTVTLDGVKLPDRPLAPGDVFDVEWPAPPAVTGKARVEVEIETDATFVAPQDSRKLGLVFGIVEFR